MTLDVTQSDYSWAVGADVVVTLSRCGTFGPSWDG